MNKFFSNFDRLKKEVEDLRATEFIEIWDALCIDDERLRAGLTLKILNGEIEGSEK